ncbi:hypothetical protein [Aeromonas phage 3]|nr:hypothetical protein [Aeromonas phage 3]
MTNMTKTEYVYFARNTASHTPRRYNPQLNDRANTEILADGVWVSSLFTVGEAKKCLLFCPELQRSEESSDGWYCFQCNPRSGRTLNLRRIRASKDASTTAEVLIDGKWESSGLTLMEVRKMFAFGDAEWACSPELPAEGALKMTARKLLELMEKRGFGPDMQIAQMWDDIDTICGLARSLRLRLISLAEHTNNGLTNEEHLRIRALLDIVPKRRCLLDTLKMGWKELHHELSKIVLA